MSTGTIVFIVVVVILIGLCIGLYIFGKRAQKKQAEQQEQLDAAGKATEKGNGFEKWRNGLQKVSGLLSRVDAKISGIIGGFTKTKRRIDSCSASTGNLSRHVSRITNLLRFSILSRAFS